MTRRATNRGAIYIAYGRPAVDQTRLSIASLRYAGADVPVVVIGGSEAKNLGRLGRVTVVLDEERDQGGRWQKVSLPELSPFEFTAYLDADTRMREDLDAGFAILEDGWDLVMAPSTCQCDRMLWHVGEDERAATLFAWPCTPLQLQGGVIFFRRSPAVRSFFNVWREEWSIYREQDQGALLRAILKDQPKIWLLGRPWNGGAVIGHLFGRAKRNS